MGKSTFIAGPASTMTTRFHSAWDFEGAPAILGEDGLVALALLEHLHEAAEGQEAHAVLRLLAADAHHLGPEADGEGEDLDAEDLGEGKVARLVDEDQRADEQDEVQQVHGERPG